MQNLRQNSTDSSRKKSGGGWPKRTTRGRGRAEDVIKFIECLTIPSGTGQGKPFILADFQKRFIRDIYEPHSKEDRRVVRRAILSMARKNGKTALIAAIVLAHLIGPEAIVHGEIYSAANDREQASIIFKFVKQFLDLEPKLMSKVEIIPSTKTVIGRVTGSLYRAVSAEAGTKHGYTPSVVIYDELAQSRNRDLYDVLDTSFGARDEPLFITMSTQSNDPAHILSRLIDDGLSKTDPSIVCHLFCADEDCEIDDEEQWAKANPALGLFRDREDLATAIRKAKRLAAEEPKVRNLLLNQRVSPTATLIARADWMEAAGDARIVDGEDVYLALDLSRVNDLSACVMVSADEPVRVQPFFWKPAERLIDHSNRDFGVGNLRYQEWADAGYLLTSPGRAIDPLVIATEIAGLTERYNVRALAYDRWRMNDLLREFDHIGLHTYVFKEGDQQRHDGLCLVPWGQGFKDMAPAIDALENALDEGKLIHDNNPVLNWNISNAVATMDPAGNRKIDKSKVTFRIDGAVALAMAMGLRSRDHKTAKPIDIESLIG